MLGAEPFRFQEVTAPEGNHLYVSPKIDGSLPTSLECSQLLPCSPQTALGKARPGDIIHIGRLPETKSWTLPVISDDIGAPGAPVRLVGNGFVKINGLDIRAREAYLSIENLEIDFGAGSVECRGTRGLALRGNDFARLAETMSFEHCDDLVLERNQIGTTDPI